MTRTSILSVIPTLESGPGSQRLRSPNCVPGADRSPALGRVAERSTAVPTARSGRKASETTGKSCRYADTRQSTRRDRAVRLGRRVRSRRAAPIPARRHPKTRTRNLKYRIMKHLLLLLALLCLAQRSAAQGGKIYRSLDDYRNDRYETVPDLYLKRRRSRIRTLRIQARLHGPGNEKDAQGNGVRRRRRYALREPDLFE